MKFAACSKNELESLWSCTEGGVWIYDASRTHSGPITNTTAEEDNDGDDDHISISEPRTAMEAELII